MRILYSISGFEQDAEPQLCLEGTCLEFDTLAHRIEVSIQSNALGEIIKLEDNDNGVPKLIFIREKGGRKLLEKVDSNKYVISLDVEVWAKVLDLIHPLTSQKGYQFIEFNDSKVDLIEDVGLIFRAI